jgi:hypothetical protein
LRPVGLEGGPEPQPDRPQVSPKSYWRDHPEPKSHQRAIGPKLGFRPPFGGPFLHTLRAQIEVIFVRKCSCPNLSSQRGTFCMGPDHKKPLFGPGLYGPEISSSAWKGTWSLSPSPSLPTGPLWWSWTGPNLVVASDRRRPTGRSTNRVPRSSRPSPSGLGVFRGPLNRKRGGVEGRGGTGPEANWSPSERSSGWGGFLFTSTGRSVRGFGLCTGGGFIHLDRSTVPVR